MRPGFKPWERRKFIKKMIDSPDSFSSKYDILMKEIKKNAEITGLKNFSHKKNEIPSTTDRKSVV